MKTAEKLHDLIEKLEQDARKATVADILIDLEASLQQASKGEEMGIRAAIEIISTNYDH
ncbi:hypothetical protein ACQP1P_38470 [Dactylosporangium sp. CA-052675]|uniref:hypothetical protein n=1 Tax=Dactylosporangium sp. CA-052675 TaxID=3239927 RepID=UPI003D8C8AC5